MLFLLVCCRQKMYYFRKTFFTKYGTWLLYSIQRICPESYLFLLLLTYRACTGKRPVFISCVSASPAGLTQEGLFRVNGNVKVVEQLRLKFESGAPVELREDGDVCAAASLLKLFLRELPESVIPAALRPRFLQLFQGQCNK